MNGSRFTTQCTTGLPLNAPLTHHPDTTTVGDTPLILWCSQQLVHGGAYWCPKLWPGGVCGAYACKACNAPPTTGTCANTRLVGFNRGDLAGFDPVHGQMATKQTNQPEPRPTNQNRGQPTRRANITIIAQVIATFR